MQIATATGGVRQQSTSASDILTSIEHALAAIGPGNLAPDGTRAGVPVFRDGRLSGFVQRAAPGPVKGLGTTSGDVATQSQLNEALTQQLGLHSGRVGVTVEKGVVHLFGQADGSHAVLAARRVVAAAPDTAAIIDDLWVECE